MLSLDEHEKSFITSGPELDFERMGSVIPGKMKIRSAL